MNFKGIFIAFFLHCCFINLNAQHLDNGDYRSIASGNWSDITIWQVRTGINVWGPAVTAPTLNNSVFLQNGHTIFIDVSIAECDSLNISNTATPSNAVLNIGTNILKVYGKLRAFTQPGISNGVADGNIPGTSTNTLINSGTIIYGNPAGKIQLAGTSRSITQTGEWGANPQSWIVDFALNPGETGTIETGFKAGNITFSSGDYIANNGLRADSGSAGTGIISIKTDASLKLPSNATLQRLGTAGANSHFRKLTVEQGGTLNFSGIVGAIGSTEINFNGLVIYSSVNAQTLVSKGANSNGTDPFLYNDLTLQSSSKTLAIPITVNGILSMRTSTGNTPSLNLGGFQLNYGPLATLQYRGIGNPVPAQTTADSEWPAGINAPPNVNIYSTADITLNNSKLISDTLSFSGANAKLILGNFDISVKAVKGFNNVKYCVTNGNGSLSIRNLGSTDVIFPIGISGLLYNPFIVNNSGIPDTYTVRVAPGIPCNATISSSVNCIWTVSKTDPTTGSANLSAQWNLSEENPGFDRTNCRLVGCDVNGITSSGTIGPAAGSGPYTQISNAVNAWGNFGVTNIVVPAVDLSAQSLVTPVDGGCKSSAEIVSISFQNNGVNQVDFTINPVNITVTTTGGYNSSIIINTGILAAGAIQNVTMPSTINMSAGGTFIFNINISALGDNNTSNNTQNNITINAAAGPSATINYSANSFCITNNTPQTVSINGTTGGVFSSTSGLNLDVASGIINPSASTAGSYVVNYQIPASGGCPLFNTSTNVIIESVSIAPTSVQSSIISSCGPALISLNQIGGILSSGADWKWYSGSCGGTLLGTGNSLSNLPVTTTTVFFVRAEGGACTASSCADINITIDNPVTVDLTIVGDTIIAPGEMTMLVANTSGTGSGYLYTWFKNGIYSKQTTENSILVSVDSLGTYSVQLSTPGGCNSSSNQITIGARYAGSLFISPNPTTGFFTVKYYNEKPVSVGRKLYIYDALGRLVYSKLFIIDNAYSTMNVDFSGMAKGLYFVSLRRSDGKKIIDGSVVVR